MGRPLKIAKAQAVLTITDTAETGGVVTVTQNLTTAPTVGVMAGMPFVVATSVGGLTAGVTYYILAIIDNHTFTVSSTQLSVQPQVSPTLSDTTGGSVSATVGIVDAYFNNPVSGAGYPATNTATYSVVGGNTAIFGSQVLAQVAIGINGTGTLSGVSTSNAYVFGTGTDFANVTTGAALQVAVANINGRTDYTNIGFVSSTHGAVSVAVANTANTGNIIGTSGTATNLVVNQPVTFDGSLGGLVAGTVYYVKAIANAAAFTVSTKRGGPEVDLSDATGTPNALQQRLVLTANSPITFTDAAYVYANDEAGYIVRQKGKEKYLVTGGTTGLTAQCLTANVANTALTPNTMAIIGTYANSATVKIQSLSDHTMELFTATSGPVASGNIVFPNANPAFATFNTAYAANSTQYSDFSYGNAQPYPIVTVNKA